MTLTFRLVVVDESPPTCGPRSCINFSEFIWENIKIFTFLNYSIICVSHDPPTILHLQHYRSTSYGWSTHKLCETCLGCCRTSAKKFVGNFTFPGSCNCNVCLRQRPTLRNLASNAVFCLRYNLTEFGITNRTFTSMFARQSRPLFPIILWFHRTTHYNVRSSETCGANSAEDFTKNACPRQNVHGPQSSCTIVLAMRT